MPKTSASAAASKRLGQRIKDARKEAALTQAQLGQRMDVSASYITNLEAGRLNPTVGQIANIANALGMEYDVQFRGVPRRSVKLPDLSSR
jgi:transcriptional regulator with XRE-family HTH domain